MNMFADLLEPLKHWSALRCNNLGNLLVASVLNPLFAGLMAASAVASEAPFLVQDGEPRAQIVIAEDPTRLVDFAAQELQDHIEKISGAKLPVVTAPSDDFPVSIFLGESAYTEKLGITSEGLGESAYRIVSGPDYLVLLGRDVDFDPIQPGAMSVGGRAQAQQEWRELSGFDSQVPVDYTRSLHRESGLWAQDQSGSLQAVYQFLRDLGVRWYMPGDIGEVIPEMASIPLPEVDVTAAPDIAVRDLRLFNVSSYSMDEFAWYWRLGLNHNNLGGTHGMRVLLNNGEWKKNHPEFYFLFGETRMTDTKRHHACYSNEELLQKTIEWVRFVFDHYDLPVVNIMPDDGYQHCGCELCKDREPSEVVWEFVNKVAEAVYKTHPDHLISCGAYTAYQSPPEAIETFSPNLVVRISWVRPGLDDAAKWEDFMDVVGRWAEKIGPNRLARNANVQWTANPRYPIIFPRSIAQEYNALKDNLIGENSQVPRHKDDRWQNIGLSHLNVYVLSRFFWEAGQNLDELLDEYYPLFYGPAADQMQKAFEFMESAYPRLGSPQHNADLKDTIQFIEMVEEARKTAGSTIYGERIDLVLDALMPVEDLKAEIELKSEVLARRNDNPLVVAADTARGQEPQMYRLLDMDTGDTPDIETRFTIRWEDNALLFDIYCEEPDMKNVPITKDVWSGDSVALLLETPLLSYYHIEINADGDVYDADRQQGKTRDMANWSSEAEVETEKGEDYWRVVVRIPVVSLEEGQDDPLHFVVGAKPTMDEPWFFNLGRTRSIASERQRFLFSPMNEPEPAMTFHEVERFGRLVVEE